MENFDPQNIDILDVRTVSFSATNPGEPLTVIDAEDVKQYRYRFGYRRGINEDEKLVRIILYVYILGLLPGKKKYRKIGHITTESFFYLEDFDDWVEYIVSETGEEFGIFDEFMNDTLVGLAYSTTRGILLRLGNNSILEDCILPVVDPSRLKELDDVVDS